MTIYVTIGKVTCSPIHDFSFLSLINFSVALWGRQYSECFFLWQSLMTWEFKLIAKLLGEENNCFLATLEMASRLILNYFNLPRRNVHSIWGGCLWSQIGLTLLFKKVVWWRYKHECVAFQGFRFSLSGMQSILKASKACPPLFSQDSLVPRCPLRIKKHYDSAPQLISNLIDSSLVVEL